MRKPFFFLCFLAAAASLYLQAEPTPYPTGRITLKTAVVVYNPIVTNTIENAHGGIFSEEMGWGNATNTVDNIVNWWRQCSRGMVNLEVVYWTNLFQVMKNMPDRDKPAYRPSIEKVFEAARARKEFSVGHQDEQYCLTNDVPYVWEKIKNKEVDLLIQVVFPFAPGGWESLMQGEGASWCNSWGRHAPIEHCFMSVYPTTERQDTPMENFGHAFESLISTYYSNSTDWNYNPQGNEWTLFTRQSANTNANFCHVGYVHYAPNTPRDYLWGEDTIVYSYAPGWLRYPNMLKYPPVAMNTRYWGGGVNANQKQWLFYHAPQRYGLYRGHLMNWLTIFLNLNTAAYPMTPGETLVQEVDPRGWFTFQVHAPAGTTAVVFRAESPKWPLHSGIRKEYIPKRYRFGQEDTGKAYAEFTEPKERTTDKTWVITPDKEYAKEMEGNWFFICGGGDPTNSPLGLCELKVTAEVLPKPEAEPLEVKVTMPEKIEGDEAQIVWTATQPKVGLRGVEISFSENGPSGPFEPICHDFAFELTSPYRWFLPEGSYERACVKVEIEDCYGRTASAISKPFSINTENEWQMYDVPNADDAWGDRLICTKAGTDGKDYYFSKGNVKMSPFFRRSGNAWQPLENMPCGRRDDMTDLVPYKGGLITSLGYTVMDADSNRFTETGLAFYDPKTGKWEEGRHVRGTASGAAMASVADGSLFIAEEGSDHVSLVTDWKKRTLKPFPKAPGGPSYQWAAADDGSSGAFFVKFDGSDPNKPKGIVFVVNKKGEQMLLGETPYPPGVGCSMVFLPSKYSKEKHAKLLIARGGQGYRRPWVEHEDGKRFNVDCHKNNLMILDLHTGKWEVQTLPVPTDEGSRLTLVGDKLYLLGASNIHNPLRVKTLKTY